MKKIKACVTMVVPIGILLFLSAHNVNAQKPGEALKAVREALAKANYNYGKPLISNRAISGDTHLPSEVMEHIYWNKKHNIIRIDFFSLPTFLRKERYLISEIYLYYKSRNLRYAVWLNRDDNEIERFVHYLPSKVLKKDKTTGIEILDDVEIYYDDKGSIIKKIDWKYTLNHKKKEVTYIMKVFNSAGVVMSTEKGERSYGDRDGLL
jgi:hypothetical protein